MAAPRRARGGAYEPVADQLAALAALEGLARHRALTPAEAARMELLLDRERQRARYRPQRMAKLRAELAMLEAQERAAEQRELAVQRRLPLVFVVRAA